MHHLREQKQNKRKKTRPYSRKIKLKALYAQTGAVLRYYMVSSVLLLPMLLANERFYHLNMT